MGGERTYYDKGSARKKQIYEWYLEEVFRDSFLRSQLAEVKILISQNKLKEAFDLFNLITQYFVNEQDTLGYIIYHTRLKFGKDVIDRDLFNGVMKKSLMNNKRRLTSKVARRPVRKADINEFVDTKKEVTKKPVRYGFTKKGERKRGKIEFVVVKQVTQPRLRDVKTGRFLKASKSVKKEFDLRLKRKE